MKKTLLAIVAVAIANASFAQIEVGTNGNVNIGEYDSNNNYKLNVKGTTSLNGNTKLDGNLGIGTNPDNNYKLYVKGVSKFTGRTIIWGNDGQLGIGATPNTNEKLRVNGNSAFAGNITIENGSTLIIGAKTIEDIIIEKIGSNQGNSTSSSTSTVTGDVNCNTIKTSGKVTIGYPSTTTSLLNVGGDCAVNGTIKALGCVNSGSVSTSSVSAQTVSAQYLKYSVSCTKSSDKRFKKNIKNLPTEVVSKLKQIESKTYQYKSQDELLTLYQSVNGDTAQVKYFDTNRDQYGFLAQDFENVFPELVYTDSVGLKSIDYISLIPILLQAIQEQQAQIDYLLANAEIKTNNGNHNGQDNGNNGNGNNGNGNGNGNSNKRNGSNNMSNANTANGNSQVALKATKPAEIDEVGTENSLFQNTPNPFSQETQIEYTLANDAQNAMICIYNMNGEQLRCFPLNIESSGVITIEGNDLVAGMYLYSLLVDDQLIDTKRMVLTF